MGRTAQQQSAQAEVQSPQPGQPKELVREFLEGPTLAGRVLALQRLAGNASVRRLLRAQPTAAPPAPAASGMSADVAATRAGLLKGAYRGDKGASVFTAEASGNGRRLWVKFVDDDLNAVLKDLLSRWAPTVKDLIVGTGDTSGKNIAEHPEWVITIQEKLIGQTPQGRPGEYTPKTQTPGAVARWDEDSSVAQRLIEVYMLSWHKAQIGAVAPPNVAELYARIGASEYNAQANLIGGEAGGPNWCGPASERAIPLAFMRRGLRLKTGAKMIKPKSEKPSRDDAAKWQKWQIEAAIAFKAEVTRQGAFFITNKGWGAGGKADKKDPYAGPGQERVVQRPKCYTTPLKSGDYIYLMGFMSPVSGHVATVIQEKELVPAKDWAAARPGTALSEILMVSGNARRDAVRAERVIRERPPREYNYDTFHPIGNEFDRVKAEHAKRVREAAGPHKKALEDAVIKLIAWAQKNMKGQSLPHPDPKQKFKYPAYQYPRLFPGAIGAIQQHFAAAGDLVTEYVKAAQAAKASSAEADKWFAGEEERLRKKAEAEAGGMPLTRLDPKWETLNKQDVTDAEGKPVKDDKDRTLSTGRWAPRDKDRIWVVAILRMSLTADLDAELAAATAKAKAATKTDSAATRDAIAGKEAQYIEEVAAKYGLERMEGSIQEIYGDALEYWSAAGAFQ